MILINSDYKSAIIGLGYVGLPLLLDFCEAGLQVIGFDIDQAKIDKLQNNNSYISYISDDMIAAYREAGSLEVSSDFGRLKEVQNIIITVPTPLTDHREPDLSYIKNTAQVIARYLCSGQLIVLESTTYPGTTREVLLPVFEKIDFHVGQDYFLAYSPERVDPNKTSHSARSIPKVLGGITDRCLNRVQDLYSKVFKTVVPVSSVEAAESSKLLENIFRSVNIAMVNEMKILFDRMGIDIWEVINASSSKPFGFMPFYPGPGLGGHCIPIDPFYLTWKAREYDFSTRFIELAGEINSAMPLYVVQKTLDALNDRGKSIKKSRVLVLGAAYKKDIDDIRESPAVKIITLLKDKGADVHYHDPYIPVIQGLRKYPNFELHSVQLDKQMLKGADCVMIITDHSCYDYQWLVDNSSLIVDTRNAIKLRNQDNVVKA